MPIRILNWNIQNFGPTKSGLLFDNFDIVEAIGDVVIRSQADIFVLIELNTTSVGKARQICAHVLTVLQRDVNTWRYILSPNTGKEFYAFFVKDTTVTIPYGATQDSIDYGQTLANVNFVEYGTQTGLMAPLIGPDQQVNGANMPWLGPRLGAFLPFKIPGPNGTPTQMLPIMACHFAAKKWLAQAQLRTLNGFSLFNNFVNPVLNPVSITLGGNAVPIAHALLLGDFNVGPATIGGYVNAVANVEVCNPSNSLYVTYRSYSRVQKTCQSLPISDLDNFVYFWQGTPYTRACRAINTATEVTKRRVSLDVSIRHYAKLDKRGFKGMRYSSIATDFVSQLTGDPSHIINIKGALLGARLISDHLPVLLTLT